MYAAETTDSSATDVAPSKTASGRTGVETSTLDGARKVP